jgi:hypothetical protein
MMPPIYSVRRRQIPEKHAMNPSQWPIKYKKYVLLRIPKAINSTPVPQWLDEHPVHGRRRSQIDALVDLFERESVLPHSIFITGLKIESEIAIGGGQFVEVFKGFYGEQAVAVKRCYPAAAGASIDSDKAFKARKPPHKVMDEDSCIQCSVFARELLSGVS